MEESEYALQIGAICIIVGGLAAYFGLKPESLFGAFVGTMDGIATVIAASIVFVLTAEIMLKKLGYPIRQLYLYTSAPARQCCHSGEGNSDTLRPII